MSAILSIRRALSSAAGASRVRSPYGRLDAGFIGGKWVPAVSGASYDVRGLVVVSVFEH